MRDPAKTLAAVYETDYRKLVNAARVLVGFDVADELVQDAFARCLLAWRRVAMSDCALRAITTGEPPNVFPLLRGPPATPAGPRGAQREFAATGNSW